MPLNHDGQSVAAKPFTKTHTRRDDKCDAQLLTVFDGFALYRARWNDGGKMQFNTLRAPVAKFKERFAC